MIRCATSWIGRGAHGPVIAVGLPLAAFAGCAPWIGPASFRIETAEAQVADFVVEPTLVKGRGHGASTTLLEAQVVSSGTQVTFPRIVRDPMISNVRFSAYHPLYSTAWTGAAATADMQLPAIRPRTWGEIVDDEGTLSYARVALHLLQVRERWLPAFPEGERARLAVYLPALSELADGAQLLSGDLSRFETEEAARQHLQEQLAAITEMMR